MNQERQFSHSYAFLKLLDRMGCQLAYIKSIDVKNVPGKILKNVKKRKNVARIKKRLKR